MAQATMDDVRQWEKKTVVDGQGNKIGKIEDVYFDEQTGRPEWALVNTGLFGLRHSFVPVTEASIEGGDIVRVQWDADHVKNAPQIESDQELSVEEEQRLARHYNMEYSQGQSQTGLPQGGRQQGERQRGAPQQGRQGGGDTAMTRSEEEIRVGKARNPSELIRLKKHVVTENVEKTIPVQHEELRVEREPITDENRAQATSGPEIRENVHEETLYEEQPVIAKRVVPKERVQLGKETVTEEEHISEQARKEKIDVERGDARERGRREQR